MRIAQLLRWAEVLGSLALACELEGLVPEEEWWVALTPQGPPKEDFPEDFPLTIPG